MPNAVIKNEFLAYSGSNSADVLAFVQVDTTRVWSIASESGGILTLEGAGEEGPPLERAMSIGDVVVASSGEVQFRSEAEFEALYVELGPRALSLGAASTPNLLAGGQTTVPVTLVPAQPSSSYLVAARLAGSAQLLGSLEIVSIAIVDAETVNVVVRNGGLLALAGATVIVTAVS